MSVIGIDLGTTNSLVAVWKDGKSVLIPNVFKSFLTPSAVSIDKDGSILVGQAAKERLISQPDCSIASFKRFMGTDKKFVLGKKVFNAEELSALVIKQLKQDAEFFLGEEVTEAIISVPAYFNDRQRNATKRAGEFAGVTVNRLVNEPSAAALYCRMIEEKDDCCFLVYDFGGGTLDVSLVDCFENIINIVSVSGNNHLGGNDFDKIISEYFCRVNSLNYDSLSNSQKEIIAKQSELAKMALSTQDTALMIISFEENKKYSMALTNKKLIEISTELLLKMEQPIKNVLIDSQTAMSSIDDIILVGGTCKMPVVKEYLSHTLKRPISTKASPELMVALGIGYYAGIKERNEEIKDIVLTDICPFSLGVDVINHNDANNNLMMPIIERNSSLPSSKEHGFVTANDNQKEIFLGIFQGENIYANQNLKLGELKINVKQAPRGEECIDVRFTYDINGILVVDVTVKSTGEKKSLVIIDDKNSLSKDNIDKKISELSKLKILPAEQAENRLIIAKAESFYAQTNGQVREDIANMLNWFNSVLATQESIKIEKARKRLYGFFEEVEKYLKSFDPFNNNFEYSEDDE